MSPDDLSAWFRSSRSRHDVEVEHELAQFEARVFERDRPVTLARHVLRRKLGAGAHGVVYEAYDPHLDRKVAIKVLRHCTSAAQHARLLAEARALARLAHPNVVAVHDVGIDEAGVYIVMELVEGTSLDEWLRAPRPWREVLAHLVAAGRGLEAAHRAGLVHRDFKPANVLVGDEGAVKVTDFGLATPPAAALPRPLRLAGTPLYMAPELVDPTRAGPASDQYAFCVTAWEALLREAPECEGSIVRRRGLPRALLRDLRRGLHPDPARRWPSLGALLDRLTSVSRRRARAVVGIVVGVALAASAFAWSSLPASLTCGTALALEEPLWTADDRARVQRAWAERAPFEREAVDRALDRVDAQAREWSAVARRACLQLDEPTRDLGVVACLQRQRDALVAAVEVLESPGSQDPIRVVSGLGAPEACSGAGDAALRQLPPPGIADEVAAHRRTLARADALRMAGRTTPARELAASVLEAAASLQFPRLQLEARLELAWLDDRETAPLVELAHDAAADGHDDIAASALIELASVTTRTTGRHDQALAFVDLADSAVSRGRLGDAYRDAVAVERVAVLYLAHRHHDVVALFESTPHASASLELLTAAASAFEQLGRPAEARDAAERALERARETYGSSHVQTLGAQLALANAMRHDDPEGSEHLLHDVWTRLERDIGRDHEAWFAATNDLAIAVQHNRGYTEAEPLWRELRAAIEQRYGAKSLRHALVLNNVVLGLTAEGRAAEAVPIARRALAIREEQLPARHYHVAATLDALGAALVQIGEHDEGGALLVRAIEIWGGQEPPLRRVAEPLTTLARSELERGRPAAALHRLDRALAIVDAAGDRGWPRNEILLARARALDELGRREEARESARAAVIDDALGDRPPAGIIDKHVAWLQRAGVWP